MAPAATGIIDKMTDAIDSTKTCPAAHAGRPPGKHRSIKRLLWWCFLTIVLVTLGVGAVLWSDPVGLAFSQGDGQTAHAVALHAALRWRIALGAVLIIAAAGSVFYRLHRLIVRPLEQAAAAAGCMAEGNLGVTIPHCPPNEIGRIGESMNGLAVNFQEALILVWNQTANAIDRLRRATGQMSPGDPMRCPPEMMADLTSARHDLETMQMMVRSFDLYDVTITEGDVLAAKDKADMLN